VAGVRADTVLFSADYFGKMYELAERLVVEGKAYVCDLDEDQIKEYRGTAQRAGPAEPVRERTVDDNLARLRRMKAGELPDGACTLRAKIDMASPKHEDARSAAVPYPARASPPQRRRVVHLSDVRLRASARGCDRGHHALDLHARVREQTASCTTGARQYRAVESAAHQYEFARLSLD